MTTPNPTPTPATPDKFTDDEMRTAKAVAWAIREWLSDEQEEAEKELAERPVRHSRYVRDAARRLDAIDAALAFNGRMPYEIIAAAIRADRESRKEHHV